MFPPRSSFDRARSRSLTLGLTLGAFALLTGCTPWPSGSESTPNPEAKPLQEFAAPASTFPNGSGASGDTPGSSPGSGALVAPTTACPDGMILVEGGYCPDVQHVCLKWMDPPGPYENFRCAEYGAPVCTSKKRVNMRFCVDRDEHTPQGEALPAVHQSWTSAKGVCESQGKRLCLESEWQFACEGEEMRPYPYGFIRDATACNIDRTNLGRPNDGLRDLREPAGSHPKCVSPFGVRDMSGNVEEWATLDEPTDPKDRSTMKGAWWLPGRNTCRAATTGHGETYEGPQVGVRCCKDAPSS